MADVSDNGNFEWGPTRTSPVYTISLLPELARQAEALANRDSLTMSELFRGSIPFHTYSAQQPCKILEEIGEYGASRNAGAYAEQDVPRIFAEVSTIINVWLQSTYNQKQTLTVTCTR